MDFIPPLCDFHKGTEVVSAYLAPSVVLIDAACKSELFYHKMCPCPRIKCLFYVISGVPAVFVAVWAIVRATLADAR